VSEQGQIGEDNIPSKQVAVSHGLYSQQLAKTFGKVEYKSGLGSDEPF
jgi:hypothetical protein